MIGLTVVLASLAVGLIMGIWMVRGARADVRQWAMRHRQQTELVALTQRWQAQFEAGRGRAPIVLPQALSGASFADAAAGLSALSCPKMHRNVIPVEDLTGETVAGLCLDCDKQLPAQWMTADRSRVASGLPPFTPDPRLTRKTCE